MFQTGAHGSKRIKLGSVYHCTGGSLTNWLTLRTDYLKKKDTKVKVMHFKVTRISVTDCFFKHMKKQIDVSIYLNRE